jgi:adenylosuccinate lyase
LIEDVVFKIVSRSGLEGLLLKMPCQDCERAIAELRAELSAQCDVFEQRQQAMLDAMSKVIDNLEAKNQTLLASIDRQVGGVFARLVAVARSKKQY